MTASVHIDPSDWRAVTDDRSWLKTELVANGVSVHLDAVEVTRSGAIQEIRGELADALAVLHEALAADGPWETLRIGGRDYVLVATPFS